MNENNKQQNKFLNAIKWVFKIIWLGIECIFYIIGALFGIELLLSIFDKKDKK